MKLSLVLSAFLLACSDASPPATTGDAGSAPPGDDASAPADDASTVVPEAAPPACTYPKGPYGVGLNKVLSPNSSWQGYAASDTSVTTLKMSDLFDCDGSKGINAIMIDVSAGWCAACETQAHDEGQLTSQYDAAGVKTITLLIMDAAEQPATTQTALDWRTTYDLLDVGVYADPNFLLQPNEQSIGLPITYIVDPRTMTIVAGTEGYGSTYPPQPNAQAIALAKKNSK
ncbi:MAG TPA: hypothetical protein VGH87_28315 [Polyangiaceae bacterium]